MKPTKQKHGKENIIGKIIYAFLMFIPLLAIGVTCLYVIFNKNAYQSYYGQNINQYQNINLQNNSQLIDNDNDLYMENSYFVNTTLSGTITYQDVSVESGNFANPTEENMQIIANSNRLYFYRGTSITFYNDNNQTSFVMTSMSGVILKFTNIQSTPNQVIAPAFYYIQYEDVSYVSEAFYYSIDKIQKSPLFNWSSNTTTYSVLQLTCTTLGITPQFIPMLLSYWLMMSLMYLLYDIALLIVHMAHNRIHDIESSI